MVQSTHASEKRTPGFTKAAFKIQIIHCFKVRSGYKALPEVKN